MLDQQGIKPEEIKIRFYKNGDEDQIVELLKEVFTEWPRFDNKCSLVDHWKWKFVDNPAYKDVLPHTVAEYRGEIVGILHGMLYYTKVGDETYLSEKGADAAVNQNFRGMGIYGKLEQQKNELCDRLGLKFRYHHTANPNIINKERDHQSFPFPRPLKCLVKVENVDKFFNNSIKEVNPLKKTLLQTGAYGSKALNKLTNLQLKTFELEDVSFREISMFDERINNFYEKVKPYYNFIVEKRMRYMNWRYCDKRGGDFKVWVAEEGDEIVGYLVLRINRIDQENPKGFIIDVLALNGWEDVVDYFVKFSVDYFNERHINMVNAQVIGGHPYERTLSKYGFLDSRIRPYLIYVPTGISEDLDKFRQAKANTLHYSYGEGDSI